MLRSSFHKNFRVHGLLKVVRTYFEPIEDSKVSHSICLNYSICLKDCLRSGFALFGLKNPTSLEFEGTGGHAIPGWILPALTRWYRLLFFLRDAETKPKAESSIFHGWLIF